MKSSSKSRIAPARSRLPAVSPGAVAGLAFAAAGLALAAGCADMGWITARGDPARTLARRSCTPEEAGLRLESAGGRTRMRPINMVLRRDASRHDFSVRIQGERARPLVRVRVNGYETLALLDSGSTATLVDWRAALRMGVIPLRWPGAPPSAGAVSPLMTAGGQGLGARFQGYLGLMRTVRLGGLEVSNVVAGIVDAEFGLGNRGWMAGQRVEMLLGAEFLQFAREVTFDFPGEQFRIGSWFGSAPPGVADARLIESSPVPVIEVELPGGVRIPAALDSGGDFGLWIPWKLAKQVGLPTPPAGARGLSGIGVGGTTYAVPLGALEMRIGQLDLGPVPVAIDTLGGEHTALPYALLGLDILERYEISLDYTLGLVRFRRK